VKHYYTAFSTYQSCPLQYLYKKGHPEIDLGYGLGKPVPKHLQVRTSEHPAIMGGALAKGMEIFYNNKLWHEPKRARERVKYAAIEELRKGINNPKSKIEWYPHWTPESPYKWNLCPPLHELERQVLEMCDNFFQIIKLNAVISEDAVAEGDYSWDTGRGFVMGSRPDLIYTHKTGEAMVVDGKTSRDIGRYTSKDQLYWYSLVHWKTTGILPSKCRFLYFRHPPSTTKRGGQLWTGLDDYDIEQKDLDGFVDIVEAFDQKVKLKLFDATPSFKSCQFCPYTAICEAYSRSKEETPLESRQVGNFVEVL